MTVPDGSRPGVILYGIASGSMRPTLAPDEAVLVAPCAPRDLRAGDLVVVKRPGGPVCHRFLRRRAGNLLMHGDNAWHPDAPVPETALVGRVTTILAPGGRSRPAGSRLAGLARLAGRRLKRSAHGFWLSLPPRARRMQNV